jgi:hypothetical protein
MVLPAIEEAQAPDGVHVPWEMLVGRGEKQLVDA